MSALLTIADSLILQGTEERKAIQKSAQAAIDLTTEIGSLAVTDAATAGKLTELLSIVAREVKDVEAARLSLTRPLKTKAKAIEDLFRPLSDALAELSEKGKKAQLDWHRAEAARVARERAEQERIRKEAERREFEARAAAIALSAQTGKPVEVPPSVPVVVPVIAEASRGVRTDYGTTSVRKVWTFTVQDPEAVPRRFFAIDEKAIRAAIAEGARAIPGIHIYQDEQLSVRAK